MRCAYHYGWTLVLDVLFFPANRNVVLVQDLESSSTQDPFLVPLLREYFLLGGVVVLFVVASCFVRVEGEGRGGGR